MPHRKPRMNAGRGMIHPRIQPGGGCCSTHAAAMLCLSGRWDAQKCTPDEVEKAMAQQYQIKLKGSLDDSWSDWFDGLTITHDATGDTILAGAVRDQTALYGLLDKARDLGCPRQDALQHRQYHENKGITPMKKSLWLIGYTFSALLAIVVAGYIGIIRSAALIMAPAPEA